MVILINEKRHSDLSLLVDNFDRIYWIAPRLLLELVFGGLQNA